MPVGSAMYCLSSAEPTPVMVAGGWDHIGHMLATNEGVLPKGPRGPQGATGVQGSVGTRIANRQRASNNLAKVTKYENSSISTVASTVR